MKCEICKKRRKTELHWAYIPTPDGQDIEGYDTAYFCIECSKKSFSWNLSCAYKIKGNRFIEN